ncbi:MAG: UDP-N-acetylglucosamine--N-acetylmuramyl-(pentapeptide) pyrophosphoryl-undecaprenol N-acetylglucosamine transferase, partial [Spartobacteria bacterium]
FIHESNAFPGKANRHTARFVRAVLLGFEECAAYFPKARTEFTGTPIRSTLRRLDHNEALAKLGLEPGVPTLLVMGGSQGASGINQALIKAMPSLQGILLQVIHLAGSRDARLLEDNYRRENIPAFVAAFHHQMEEVYSAADFAIARSGAASLAELATFGLPSLLVPYPYAADDHQTRNAEIFVRAKAALLLKESDLSGELIAQKIRELLGNSVMLRAMAANATALAPKNAATLVVETMEKYSQSNDAVAA